MKRLFLRQSSLLHIAIRWVYTVLIIGLTINVLLGVFQAIIANGYAGVPTLDDVRKTFIYHFALSEPLLFSILLLLILTIIILGYQADKNLSVKERQVVIESAKKEVLNGLDENIYETLSRGGSSIPEDVALLPHPSIFVGRTDVSSWLMIQLSAVQGAGLFFIQGMEGIGKTALVAQIIKRLSNYYTGGIAVILTMNNYNTRLILLDLISKYVPKKINNIEQMTNSVLRGHLRNALFDLQLRKMPSLIILEVVEEPLLQDAEFKQLLALLDSLNVTLILTSRKRAVIGLGENIVDLGGMSDSEALEFLMRESGRFSNIEQNTQEMMLLEEIITLLGGHSLAIRVLSGYLRQNPNIGLAEILKQLKGNQS